MQVWAGVGWTYLAYKVMDAHSKVWEYFFTLIFLLGAWFLINLVIAVLGASYEQQQERLHLAFFVERDRARRGLKLSTRLSIDTASISAPARTHPKCPAGQVSGSGLVSSPPPRGPMGT